jgi:hypothetical protein
MFALSRLSITSIVILALCSGCGGGGGGSSSNNNSGSGGTQTPTPDTTAPTLSITAPAGTSSVINENDAINFTGSATDGVDGNLSSSIAWSLDGVQQVTAASWNTSFATAGTYSITANVSDTAGNGATEASFTVTVTEVADLLPSNNYKARIPFVCSDDATMEPNTTDELVEVTAVSAQEFLATGVILGRPTSSSISVSILPIDSLSSVQITYASHEDDLGQEAGSETAALDINACEAEVIELTGLAADTQYYYQVSYTDTAGDQVSDVGQFHTARAAGQSFSFAIHADPHVGSLFRFDTRHADHEQQNENANEDMYAVTLSNTLASGADFLIDLGDTFMTEKNEGRGLYQSQYEAYDADPTPADIRDYPMTEQEVIGDYAYLRSLFAQAAHSLPLFLTVGNHEIEVEKYVGSSGYTPAIWGNNARKTLFPVPTACDHESFQNNGFYLGETNADANLSDNLVGNNCHDSYYAWQWGDALFIVLDPMWQDAGLGNSAPQAWGKSLGSSQYDWLMQTLEDNTDVPFKFVFMHNLVGGFRNDNGSERAGALLANYYEWGGCTEKWDELYPALSEAELSALVHPEDFDVDNSCTSEFGLYRPGWDRPIQDILLDHNVQIVFNGHDHLYVREQHPNGLVYQTVPQPSISGDQVDRAIDRAEGYNYDPTGRVPTVDTVVESSSGFLLVTVNAGVIDGEQTTQVEYRKSVQDTSCLNGSSDCYTVDAEVISTYKVDALSNLYASDTDSDGDSVVDSEDAFPSNPDEDTDTDGDGIGDNSDPTPNGDVSADESLGLTDIVLRSAGASATADFYAPATLSEKLLQERTVSWTPIAATPVNLARFSFGEAGTTDVFALTDASDIVEASLSISAGLAADTEVDYDQLLRSLFQFVEVATGEYAIYSTKHANYALDLADDGISLILRDVRSHDTYIDGSASFLTFEIGVSPLTLVANGRYLFDAAVSAANNTLAYGADPGWTTDQQVVLNGASLELAVTGTSMNLYAATIGLEIPFDFNPEQRPRFPNLEFWDSSTHDTTDRIQTHADGLIDPYDEQVATPGIDDDTLAAAQSMLDTIDVALAGQGSQTRYPQEFYLALRDGMLRREILAEESTDGQIGDLIVPYIYFTNEMDTGGNYHPYMVIATHGVPDALALLGDVPHPPGDGFVQGYDNQNVTRSYYIENFILGIPMRDYGEVTDIIVGDDFNNLLLMNADANDRISLANENNLPLVEYDHHNYASTNESAVAVDGVVVFPSYNNGLHFSQEPGELSVRAMHSGRGLGVHYHADPHGAALADPEDNTDTGLNLYNEGDYLGHLHPPIISIGFDGVAGYGFYLDGDTASDGVNVDLDLFGGHEHGEYGYHYHAFATDRQVENSSIDYTTHELGPLGAWAGRINYLPLDGFRPRNSTLWVDGQ